MCINAKSRRGGDLAINVPTAVTIVPQTNRRSDWLSAIVLTARSPGLQAPAAGSRLSMTLTSKIFFVCKDFPWRLCGDPG